MVGAKISRERLEEMFGSDEAIGVRFHILTSSGSPLLDANHDPVVLDAKAMDLFAAPCGSDVISTMPDGRSAVVCTNLANHVVSRLKEKHLLAGENSVDSAIVVGFSCNDNPTSSFATEGFLYGHDFAIVNYRYLVDPWIKLVDGRSAHAVHDLADYRQASKAAVIYGNPSTWSPSGVSYGEAWSAVCLPPTFVKITERWRARKMAARTPVVGPASCSA